MSSPSIATAVAGVAGTIGVAIVAWGVSRSVRPPDNGLHR